MEKTLKKEINFLDAIKNKESEYYDDYSLVINNIVYQNGDVTGYRIGLSAGAIALQQEQTQAILNAQMNQQWALAQMNQQSPLAQMQVVPLMNTHMDSYTTYFTYNPIRTFVTED
jgi:hypothetical protein